MSKSFYFDKENPYSLALIKPREGSTKTGDIMSLTSLLQGSLGAYFSQRKINITSVETKSSRAAMEITFKTKNSIGVSTNAVFKAALSQDYGNSKYLEEDGFQHDFFKVTVNYDKFFENLIVGGRRNKTNGIQSGSVLKMSFDRPITPLTFDVDEIMDFMKVININDFKEGAENYLPKDALGKMFINLRDQISSISGQSSAVIKRPDESIVKALAINIRGLNKVLDLIKRETSKEFTVFDPPKATIIRE